MDVLWNVPKNKQFKHLKLGDHGFEKGKTEVTAEIIENVTDLARKMI